MAEVRVGGGIVDQNVEAAEALVDGTDQLRQGVGVALVRGDGRRLAAVGDDRCGDGIKIGLLP